MLACLACLAGLLGGPGCGSGCGSGCGHDDDGEPSTAASPPARGSAVSDATAGETCPVADATLGPGLTVERWPISATPAAGGPPCIDVVRADLAHHALHALSAPSGAAPPDALTWRATRSLVAVTNAGMFHASGAPVGLIVAGGAALGSDNPKMGGFLAWDPVSPADPAAVVAGRGCPGFDLPALRRRYRSIVQSYRFLDCDGAALPWQDAKQYSAAGIGIDRAGRAVFFHARAAVTMTELARTLASHDLAGALFLEGGPESSLVVHGPDGSLDRVGSYETRFLEDDSNHRFWSLPNIIGLTAR